MYPDQTAPVHIICNICFQSTSSDKKADNNHCEWPEKGLKPFKHTRPRGYKTFSMLNSAEHEIYPAHKC